MNILYKSDPERGRQWAALIAARQPAAVFRVWPDIGDAGAVEYLVAWQPPENIMAQFPRLKVLFSVGAGADQFDYDALPPTLPVVRMVEPGIVNSMVEYVTFAVLGLHRDMPRYFQQQRAGLWLPHRVRPAHASRVGVMGLGNLGRAAAGQLAGLGFDCGGWSRTPHVVPGVRCWAGADELDAFLARTDILVCLLPLTADTAGLLDARLFSRLPPDAALVHVGRGAQLNQPDLLQALESRRLRAAVIDVTVQEPLPADHPLWRHDAVWLTPHIASQTQPDSAVTALLDNIRRFERGEAMVGLINRQQGY
ncbi:2-hydroxyacid dehydrogenase [Acerihabitans arboris]|uniref:Glyoxylate/hydroxypyruvate reductase A n=1 Tax=Acerihabitans arboris TaxID=2691583 RepID=A0A845SBM1_9GAMM|nr:glyoxylate/hydroxypyruvate reductase A [Acerihabitans arboris]NDL62233.1 glyoxylate/hydroxypyruvate reductase A [Acerihabitans arboris]